MLNSCTVFTRNLTMTSWELDMIRLKGISQSFTSLLKRVCFSTFIQHILMSEFLTVSLFFVTQIRILCLAGCTRAIVQDLRLDLPTGGLSWMSRDLQTPQHAIMFEESTGRPCLGEIPQPLRLFDCVHTSQHSALHGNAYPYIITQPAWIPIIYEHV